MNTTCKTRIFLVQIPRLPVLHSLYLSMARGNRRKNRARRGRTSRSKGARLASRRADVVHHNAIRVSKLPPDPPQLAQTAERNYIIRCNWVYDKDTTGPSLISPNQADGVWTLTTPQASASLSSMSRNLTRGLYFTFHGGRFGSTTGVAIALKKLSVWGPNPQTLDGTLNLTWTPGTRAPQRVFDRGTGMHRPRVALTAPQLDWYTATSTAVEAVVELDMNDSTLWDHEKDWALGVIDFSFVARSI